MPEVEGTVVLVVEATVEAVVVDMMLAGLSGELSWFLSVFLTPGGLDPNRSYTGMSSFQAASTAGLLNFTKS